MNRSKIFFVSLAIFSLLSSGCYWQSTYVIPNQKSSIPSKVKVIAVFPFKDARTIPYHIKHFRAPASEIQEKLIARISAIEGIQVIEREQLDKLFEEQKLQITGAIDPNTAVQMGKTLGVQAILMGSVNQYGRCWWTMAYATTLVTFRLVDVETGKIILSREIEANNINMFYPYRNLRDSLSQTVNAIARVINEAVSTH